MPITLTLLQPQPGHNQGCVPAYERVSNNTTSTMHMNMYPIAPPYLSSRDGAVGLCFHASESTSISHHTSAKVFQGSEQLHFCQDTELIGCCHHRQHHQGAENSQPSLDPCTGLIEIILCCEGSETQEQVTQRGCGCPPPPWKPLEGWMEL